MIAQKAQHLNVLPDARAEPRDGSVAPVLVDATDNRCVNVHFDFGSDFCHFVVHAFNLLQKPREATSFFIFFYFFCLTPSLFLKKMEVFFLF
jgi:hypothetical protein